MTNDLKQRVTDELVERLVKAANSREVVVYTGASDLLLEAAGALRAAALSASSSGEAVAWQSRPGENTAWANDDYAFDPEFRQRGEVAGMQFRALVVAHSSPSSVETGVAERALIEQLWGALNFILAFYEPGQRYLDTKAWKQAEAGGRRAHKAAREYLDAALSSAPAPSVEELRGATIEECAKRLEETAANLRYRANQTIAEWTGSDLSEDDNHANRADARSDRSTAEVYDRAAATIRTLARNSDAAGEGK